jgi:two-component system, OmpR family, KDP operon response regulator KdpE
VNVRLLIIEDDPQIRRFLRTALSGASYDVFEADTAQQGLREAAARRPDAILLDLGLPDRDGVEVLKELRAWTTVPILILSARGQEEAKVHALDHGADDYVVKPFGTGELLARLRVALRHANSGLPANQRFETEGFSIDFNSRQVRSHGRHVHLTPTEFKLLAELVRHAGKVLTQKHLLQVVWGPSHGDDTHYLRLYMAQLRSKLEHDPTDPKLLLTEQGIGYRLNAAE